ncbi:hypothetical protein H072_2951 [Dactylellina haptotyla CBS 200.50]|uniref:Cation efflux protein transmembrane domain-containing protein n=1 Tax=Dactylellina haptotyla (strain CBS 200.50) TaxID=1284197 RepID=S8AJG6_DACHA|nr:hypothetical protein H072_2951 [Dactylellina haptotyla CBS 200.50]
MSGESSPATSPTSHAFPQPRRSITTPLPDFPLSRPHTPLFPGILNGSPSLISLRSPSLTLDTNASPSDGLLRRASQAMASNSLRSQRLVGTNNRRYQWERYRTSEEDLKKIKKKSVREYYQKVNQQIDRYIWVDRLLDSALVPRLLSSYAQCHTIPEGAESEDLESGEGAGEGAGSGGEGYGATGGSGSNGPRTPLRRRPSYVRKMADEETPLLDENTWGEESEEKMGGIVKLAIYVNLAANTILLIGKIVVTLLTSSLSVLASLVDSALDFLSTAIIGLTTYLISRRDNHRYPVGRRRLEPIGVLVFAVIMIVSFIQVAVEALQRLLSDDKSIIHLSNSAIVIMALTVGIKGGCYIWCRLIKSSSVQALAQDALTDVYFNTFSILFPLVGYATQQWWLDPLGGLLLSLYVVFQWSGTSLEHIEHLTGSAASAEDRNLILYVCMRFARSIKKITGVQAYYAGDAINVEAEILFDEDLPLRDSHDVAEALQYTIESIPFVDRAFVHTDYSRENPTTHLER